METYRRGTDGRRIFSPEFKREQIARVLRKELTVAELSRELGVEQSVVRRWKHPMDRGSAAAVAADEPMILVARALRLDRRQERRAGVSDLTDST